MSSNAFIGVGTQFKREDPDSSGIFTAVAEVNSIDGPDLSRDTVDVTSLDSAGGYREYKTGFRDGGTITLELNFTIGGFNMFLDDFGTDDPVYYQIVMSDTGNTTLEMAGFVVGIPPRITPDDKVTLTIRIKVTGALTLTT